MVRERSTQEDMDAPERAITGKSEHSRSFVSHYDRWRDKLFKEAYPVAWTEE